MKDDVWIWQCGRRDAFAVYATETSISLVSRHTVDGGSLNEVKDETGRRRTA